MSNTDHPEDKERALILLRSLEQEAKECADRLGLPLDVAYDVLAVIHGQARLGGRDHEQSR